MNKINYGTIKVLKNTPLNNQIYHLKFFCEGLEDIGPGQFIMLDCVTKEARQNFVGSPLLKRPFSIYLENRSKCEYEILYKNTGIGTSDLTRLKEGDEAYFLGPLGKVIDVESLVKSSAEGITLVGGGVGIAPLTFLVQFLRRLTEEITVYFSAYEYDGFMMRCIEDLNWIVESQNIYIACEKRIGIYKGFIGDAIKSYTFMEGCCLNTTTIVCGPELMMKQMHEFRIRSLYDLYVFMERRMACGVGVCLSCNIGGQLVCKDGPLFNSKDVFD
jgi:dihydroorotate dehydrogenase electron transfer subunit